MECLLLALLFEFFNNIKHNACSLHDPAESNAEGEHTENEIGRMESPYFESLSPAIVENGISSIVVRGVQIVYETNVQNVAKDP